MTSGEGRPVRPPSPFHDRIGLEILDAPAGHGATRLPDELHIQNFLGTVHGGALFSAGEVAAGTCIGRLMGEDAAHLTLLAREMSIRFLKPARGAITARAVSGMTRDEVLAALALKPSTSIPLDIEITDDTGLVVASLTAVWYAGLPR
jgi:acyl-coenzyme A thioesterase PaaI-like protein